MKNSLNFLGVVTAFFLLFSTLVPGVRAQESAEEKTLYVEVKSSRLRATPKHWGKKLGDLKQGDQLLEIAPEGEAWFKVRTTEGTEGYVHASAVTTKKVLLKNSGTVESVDDPSEVVLAGKGFSKEIESSYSGDDPSLNYDEVDKMEKLQIDPEEIGDFMKQGELQGAE